ncbi:hypothetical protein VNO78_01950 [Psophocarpus tetragonolobus]|uniref:Uncharacterized protein n=1 Tax=Psophocarpus tetragonolobus TaxID=3891 RepID=A0AAN9SZZ8_PSOTE
MENQKQRHQNLAVAAMLLAFLLMTPSMGRPLNDDNYLRLGASEDAFNLALPSDRAEEGVKPGHVSRCGEMRVARGKYGALILNMLPKGPVPPSAPSKGTNNLNN